MKHNEYLATPVHKVQFDHRAAWRGVSGTPKQRAQYKNQSPMCQWLILNVSAINPPKEHFLPRGDEWYITVQDGVQTLNICYEVAPEILTEFTLRFG